MKNKTFPMLAVAALLAALFPARAHAGGENQFFGTVTGALVGGIAGNQFGHGSGRAAATAAGVVGGGWLGNDIGYSLDNSREGTQASSGPRVQPLSPGNAPVLNGLYVPNYVAPNDASTPESVYDNSRGSYCRAFSEQVRIGDDVQENYGTACLQPDGSWRAVSEE